MSVSKQLIDWLWQRVWWRWPPAPDWLDFLYRGMNLAEGAAWLVFAGLVLWRRRQGARSRLELAYAASFASFALTDFREAVELSSWLIALKGINLAALLWLRRLVIRRHYPHSRTY